MRHASAFAILGCLTAALAGCATQSPRIVQFQSHPAQDIQQPSRLLRNPDAVSVVCRLDAQTPEDGSRAIAQSPVPAPSASAEFTAVSLVGNSDVVRTASDLPTPLVESPCQPVSRRSVQSDETSAGQEPPGEEERIPHILFDTLPQTDAGQRETVQTNFVEPQPAEFPASTTSELSTVDPAAAPRLELNLATALGMVGGQHPAVGFAQWRVQEAYADLDRARSLWLPSINVGVGFNRHDGNLQGSNGQIADVNRNSFQYGLGAGAVGAGTFPIPGVVARFHAADAVFQPRIAQKTAWARGHAVSAVLNAQLLEVAVAYNELLAAEQDLRVIEDTRERMKELSRITTQFAEAGQGLFADADRVETEVRLLDSRKVIAEERAAVASARLAQALSTDAGHRIVPTEPALIPVSLAPDNMTQASLISTGLSNRPELREAQALVAAACDEHQRQRYAPFVPSLLLGFSTGGFGGGTGGSIRNVDDRIDADAVVAWEIRNLGQGEMAARNATRARVEQARFENVRLMDQVAREVSESAMLIQHRRQRIEIAEHAITAAMSSWEHNAVRIREGQGLPIEVLQSVQALETARRSYVSAVADYNEAQYRLQWSLGWPVHGPTETP